MDPYVQKPILRSADMTHAEDCAVKVYQAPFCTCGALNRWLYTNRHAEMPVDYEAPLDTRPIAQQIRASSSRGLTNNQCDARDQ